MNILIIFFITCLLSITSSASDELKPNEVSTPELTVDKNKNDVFPTYTNIDNAVEKSVAFPWGKVYYSSVTKEDDHTSTSQNQTQLNLRYECNGAKSKSFNVQRFSFCGYAKSEVDTSARNHQLREIKKRDGHEEKTDRQLNAIYDQEFNDRIIDPVWNISDSSSLRGTNIEITVRQKAGLYGLCEEKISKLSIPVNCK